MGSDIIQAINIKVTVLLDMTQVMWEPETNYVLCK
jgi:hypothetical protein